MKTLQILGPGCSNCQRLAENTRQAAEELGIEFELEKITDLNVIIGFGVMRTPALAVDGVVKISGKVPEPEDIKKLIS